PSNGAPAGSIPRPASQPNSSGSRSAISGMVRIVTVPGIATYARSGSSTIVGSVIGPSVWPIPGSESSGQQHVLPSQHTVQSLARGRLRLVTSHSGQLRGDDPGRGGRGERGPAPGGLAVEGDRRA